MHYVTLLLMLDVVHHSTSPALPHTRQPPRGGTPHTYAHTRTHAHTLKESPAVNGARALTTSAGAASAANSPPQKSSFLCQWYLLGDINCLDRVTPGPAAGVQRCQGAKVVVVTLPTAPLTPAGPAAAAAGGSTPPPPGTAVPAVQGPCRKTRAAGPRDPWTPCMFSWCTRSRCRCSCWPRCCRCRCLVTCRCCWYCCSCWSSCRCICCTCWRTCRFSCLCLCWSSCCWIGCSCWSCCWSC